MSEKIGYVLIGAGVVTIIAVVINIFLVFTNKTDPIQFYKPGDISIDISQFMPSYEIPGFPGAEAQPTAPELSSDALTESLNLLIHLFLTGFIINAAFKIASVGTQMTRPIIVKVNKTEQVVSPKPSESKQNTDSYYEAQ